MVVADGGAEVCDALTKSPRLALAHKSSTQMSVGVAQLEQGRPFSNGWLTMLKQHKHSFKNRNSACVHIWLLS